MGTLYLTIGFLYFLVTELTTNENVKNNELLENDNAHEKMIKTIVMRHFGLQTDDTENKKYDNKANILKKSGEPFENHKKKSMASGIELDTYVGTEHPWLQRRPNNLFQYRRQYKYKDQSEGSQRESSTSSEMQHWRDEFDLDWVNKKMIAVKDKINTSGSITIKMAGGRPWGIPCGDPNQHDLPWGTCVLPYECDGEFRIYRGDVACGNSAFVCCALQLTATDLYQALDMSFIETSVSTDSNEKMKKRRGSRENKRRKKARDVFKKRYRRLRMKRTIKKAIRKIARQIRKALNRAFRNATGDRRQKTKLLKKKIKEMKKKFYFERKVAKNIHDFEIQKVDNALQHKLKYVKDLNHHFLMNDTYREIILNNNNRTGVRALLEEQLKNLTLEETKLGVNSSKPSRRSGSRMVLKRKKRKRKDYLDYDIEYGLLYY